MKETTPLGRETAALLRAVIEPSTPTPTPRWHPPHELDGLRIVRTLGRGGMGQVYLAEEMALGRLVAIKFLAPSTYLSAERNERLLSEARVLAALRHPAIVVLYRVGTVGDRAYLVHEFVDGPSLSQATKPMPARRALRIGQAVAGALAAVHAAGIVHGDVKPSNVMLTSDDSARLIDFGLAHVESRPPHLQGGTPGYIAPEARRTGRSTSRSDVYAFALVMLEMLTGSRDPAALRSLPRPRARSAWIPPPELVLAVERGLSDDEHERPTAAALHELCGSLLAGYELAPAPISEEPTPIETIPPAPFGAHALPDGLPFDVVDTPLCRQTIWMPKPWIVLARQHGVLGVQTARAMERAAAHSISLGFRPSGFVDALDVKGYTPDHRAVTTKWIARELPRLTAMHVLTRSRIVGMGIAVSNLVLNGAIRMHSTQPPFDRALEHALAHPTRS